MSTNSEERMKILAMLEENKLTADQAALLLNALEDRGRKEAAPAPKAEEAPEPETDIYTPDVAAGAKKPGWFRVQVSNTNTGKAKVHVRLPLSLVNVGLKIGAHYTDELQGINLEELMEALSSCEGGKLVEVFDEEDGEHVEIFVE
jgi:hypothetical protein